jgi:hypothetical protein
MFFFRLSLAFCFRERRILRSLPDASVLMSELQDFRAEVSDTGAWRFGARSGKHDDLVLALAIALWRARMGEQFAGWIGFYDREARRARGELPLPKPVPLPILEERAAPACVALHAPKPFENFALARGIRYCSNEAGVVVVDPEHVSAMLGMGCWLITKP